MNNGIDRIAAERKRPMRHSSKPFFTGMPPDFKSIDDTLKYLIKTVWEIQAVQLEEQAYRSLKTYSTEDLAQAFEITKQAIRKSPWLLPNYGNPDIGVRPGRWFYDTVAKWYAIPEEERRLTWERMGSEERLKAMGKTKQGGE